MSSGAPSRQLEKVGEASSVFSAAASLLRSLFGYNDDPSLLEAAAYLGYLAVVGRSVLMAVLASRPRIAARPA